MSALKDIHTILEGLTKSESLNKIINELITELDQYLVHIQKSRGIIRKHASVVPFSPAKTVIRAFGSPATAIP